MKGTPKLLALLITIVPMLFGFATLALAGTEAKDPAKRGAEIYLQACAACHATGVAGAPKLGDQAAWAPHIKMGLDHLVEIAIRGQGAMPPRGGQSTLSDEDVRAAVKYMMEKSK